MGTRESASSFCILLAILLWTGFGDHCLSFSNFQAIHSALKSFLAPWGHLVELVVFLA